MLPAEGKDELAMSIEEELISEHKNTNTYIFFDFECTQDDQLQCNIGYKPDHTGKCINCAKSNCGAFEHVPNLCVVHKVCTQCMNIEITDNSDCDVCGKREMVFKGSNTVKEFCRWLFSEVNYNSTVICHNFQGYDSYPILKYLYQNGILPSIVPNGAKIMSLTVPACKIRMIDSLNFLPMALSKLPAMFGFNELEKGTFPHAFNRKENQQVISDHLPEVHYYNPDGMKPDDRAIFLNWYKENKTNPFDFEKELLKYCRSDVEILRRCCLKFRDDFMSITGIDPFERCITIASACNLVFRTNFLQPEALGIIPPHGYNPAQIQSIKALQWIKYTSHVKRYTNPTCKKMAGEKGYRTVHG